MSTNVVKYLDLLFDIILYETKTNGEFKWITTLHPLKKKYTK